MVKVRNVGQAEQFLLASLESVFNGKNIEEIKKIISEVNSYKKRISILLLIASIK